MRPWLQVGNQFETISLALAFAPEFPDEPIKLFSTAVVELQQEEGLLDHLELKYMRYACEHDLFPSLFTIVTNRFQHECCTPAPASNALVCPFQPAACAMVHSVAPQ